MTGDAPESPPATARWRRVTVIIIFLNGREFLAEAVESVLAQSFDDWELLLCDDGSTDGATELALEYAQRHPHKIRYLEHPNHENRGMSATRMLGVHASRSEFISWLDADDKWVPEKLQEQVRLLERHPEAALCYGPLTLWRSWTGVNDEAHRDEVQDIGVPVDSMQHPPDWALTFLRSVLHHPSGVLVRREALLSVGGYEKEFRAEHEDILVQAKLGMQYPVYASGKSWYWYRQHPRSCTAETRRKWKHVQARVKLLRRLEQYMQERGMAQGAIWDEIQRQLKPTRNAMLFWIGNALRRLAASVKGLPKHVLPHALVQRARNWIYGRNTAR